MLGLPCRFNPLQVTAGLEHLEGAVGKASLARPVARALGGGGGGFQRSLCDLQTTHGLSKPRASLFLLSSQSTSSVGPSASPVSPIPSPAFCTPEDVSDLQPCPRFQSAPVVVSASEKRFLVSWPVADPHGHRTGSTLNRAQVTHHNPSAPTDTVSSEKHHQPLAVYGHSALSPL